MKTKLTSILLPDEPFVIQPKVESIASILVRPGENRPFKMMYAERVEGIDYSAFVCPGMFLGAMNFPAPADKPWSLSEMFSGFSWPGGGLSECGSDIPFIGMVDFYFRVFNCSDVPQRFQIKLVGQELVDTL